MMEEEIELKQKKEMTKIDSRCRFCGADIFQKIIDLGELPLANSFLKSNMLNNKESFYPLQIFVCSKCLLVQAKDVKSPEEIFHDYVYFSSYSETWLEHVNNYVEKITSRFGFDKNCHIIEIGSNDGYLLQYFKKKGIPSLGIEPASNVANVGKEKGIPTLIKFFGIKIAKELVNEGKKADLLIGNNVLSQVKNLDGFMKGMKILLKPEGIITMEFQHLLQLIKHNQFDTIYHEHFSYFSFFVVEKIFSSYNLTIFDVEELSTHGGSLRLYAKHAENTVCSITDNVKTLLKKEKQFGLANIPTYINFSEKIKTVKQKLFDFVTTAKKEGKTISCYGAPAKGNILLNYCKVDTNFIDYTVDRNPYKQGLYLPGTHILIRSPEAVRKTKPDYLLILSWNLKDEIMSQMSYIREWGGKFVIPIPEVRIL